MAAVISELWDRQDSNLLIMPSSVPMDAASVQSELTRYLEDNWRPVMEKDVDGPDALPFKIDREVPTLGRYSAARRVARTIFMGSAPLAKTQNPGIDDRLIKLGCVQPGEGVATFGDAIRRLPFSRPKSHSVIAEIHIRPGHPEYFTTASCKMQKSKQHDLVLPFGGFVDLPEILLWRHVTRLPDLGHPVNQAGIGPGKWGIHIFHPPVPCRNKIFPILIGCISGSLLFLPDDKRHNL